MHALENTDLGTGSEYWESTQIAQTKSQKTRCVWCWRTWGQTLLEEAICHDPEYSCMFLLSMPKWQGPVWSLPGPFLSPLFEENSNKGWCNASPPWQQSMGSRWLSIKAVNSPSAAFLGCDAKSSCVTPVVLGRQEELTQSHCFSSYCCAENKKIPLLWASLMSFPSTHKSISWLAWK